MSLALCTLRPLVIPASSGRHHRYGGSPERVVNPEAIPDNFADQTAKGRHCKPESELQVADRD